MCHSSTSDTFHSNQVVAQHNLLVVHTLDNLAVNQLADETNANIIELDYCGIDEEYTSN